ncbi:hypothetical protein ID866_4072 [Astraeus odoratus]|nr:hypothetical protein ID866_4072 [Astraeus odoratus]
MSVDNTPRTVAVLGASYGGFRAAQVLAAGLPEGWRVVVLERNSRIHGTITSLRADHVTYIPHATPTAQSANSPQVEPCKLRFDYAIYALGSHLPAPIDLWEYRSTPDKKIVNVVPRPAYTGMKLEGIACLRDRQKRIEDARSVLILLFPTRTEFASDIAALYPRKRVTLLHSRSQLLPRFDPALGDEILSSLQDLGVRVIRGERLDLASLASAEASRDVAHVRTTTGRKIDAHLVLLCTGQLPNTTLMREMDERAVGPGGLVRVTKEMQVLVEPCGDDVTDGDGRGLDNTALADRGGDTNATATLTCPDQADDNHSGPALSSPRTFCDVAPSEPPSPTETLAEVGTGTYTRVRPHMRRSALSSETLVALDEYGCAKIKGDGENRKTVYPHIFAVGDAADAFGAHKAGHCAYYQAEVAARNIVRLVKRDERARQAVDDATEACAEGDAEVEGKMDDDDDELEEYAPGPSMIKVSLGLTRAAYEVAGVVGTKDETEDLNPAATWASWGLKDVGEDEMWK